MQPVDISSPEDFSVGSPIEVQAGDQIVRLFPLRLERGLGSRKNHLIIDGLVLHHPPAGKCYVQIRGRKIAGRFTQAKKDDAVWIVRFETLTALRKFWIQKRQHVQACRSSKLVGGRMRGRGHGRV
jgi:hypothetical protein